MAYKIESLIYGDQDSVDRAQKRNMAPHNNECKAVLILLGFTSLKDFSAKAGVNHETAGALLGSVRLRYKKHHFTVIQVHSALHAAYVEQRESLSRGARAFLKDWVKDLKKRSVNEILQLKSPGKITGTASRESIIQRDQKREKVKASVKSHLDALRWE